MGLVVLTTLALADYLVLRALDVSYFRWYLANGSLISLFLTALAAGIDLDREPRLVASDPGIFLGSWMTVPAMVSLDFASMLRDKRRPIDGLLTGLFATLLIAIWVCYLVVVAPLQYVVSLVAGAPARLALVSSSRAWVERTAENIAITSGPVELMPEGAEPIGLASRPVTVTSAFGAVLLFALSLFL